MNAKVHNKALTAAGRGFSPRLVVLLTALIMLSNCALARPRNTPTEKPAATEKPAPGEFLQTRAIEVVPRFASVRALQYPDTLDQIDYRKEFQREQKVENSADIKKFVQLLEENRRYQPEYTKRCMPVWDYGLEFKTENQKPGRLILFSFRCATIQIVEADQTPALYRDFDKQRKEFYTLFRRLLGPNVYMEDDLIHNRGGDSQQSAPDIDNLDEFDWPGTPR